MERVTADRIRIHLGDRLVLTTDQAAERAPDRWKNTAVLRAWIHRYGVTPAAELNGRTKLYYPADLGLTEEA